LRRWNMCSISGMAAAVSAQRKAGLAKKSMGLKKG
jgi:hypothetical protein